MTSLSKCIKDHGLSGRDKTLLLRDVRKHMGGKYSSRVDSSLNVSVAQFIESELDRLESKRKDIYDQIRGITDEGKTKRRVARSEREGKEPGRTVPERAPGRQETEADRVLQKSEREGEGAEITFKTKGAATRDLRKRELSKTHSATKTDRGWIVKRKPLSDIKVKLERRLEGETVFIERNAEAALKRNADQERALNKIIECLSG